MNQVAPGLKVQWTRFANEGYGRSKNRGMVIADIPAGEDIYAVCRMMGVELKRERFGSRVSTNHRALVKVMGGAKGNLEFYYAPRISALEPGSDPP